MKLTDLTIDGQQAGERMQINRMHQGLNVLLDTTDRDRDAVAQLIRYLLFGGTAEHASANGFSPRSCHAGHADIVRGPYRFRLSRNSNAQHSLQVQGLDNASQIYSGDDLFGKVDAAVFDTLYDVDFRHVGRQLSEAAVALTKRLGVSPNASRWPTEAAWLAWKQEADQLKQQLSALRQELAQQESERNRLTLQIESLAAQDLAQRQLIDRELAELDSQSTEVRRQLDPTRRELEELEARLANLQSEIDRREGELRFEPVGQSYDGLEVLYGQLDLVDVQLARWRSLQNQIQQQRLELRDEMEQWSKSLESSPEHPYHTAQQALERTNSLTTRIEQAAARIEAETPVDRSSLKQANAEVRKSCASIRQDLNLVCDELANQYRQLRHKAAAATMKHLREHYNAIAENITWLLSERQQTIAEIQAVDKVGADAISQARADFCELATREGFLAARRKFHGPAPIASGDHRAIQPDVTAERNQLQQWRMRHSELLQVAARLESQFQQLAERRAECAARRDRYYQGELASFRERLAQLSTLLAGKGLEVEQLARIDAENDRVPPYAGHPLMNQAGQLLARLTENRWTGMAVAESGANLLVTDRAGQACEVSSVEPSLQQAALLAICLATNWWLTQQGLPVPMLLREVLPTADLQQTAIYAAVLREFGLAGHQLLVFTRDRQIAEFVAQRLIAGTFSFFKTSRPSTSVGTIPTVTRELASPTVAASSVPVAAAVSNGALALPVASQVGESSWAGQMLQPTARPQHRPVVYSDRSDFRSFPAYRPPVSTSRPHLEVARPSDDTAGIAATIRPLVERANRSMSEETSLRSVDLADAIHLNNLIHAGVNSIGELLRLDPHAPSTQLTQVGFSAQQLDRWQAQAWLMLCVEGLTPSDARILIGCGITEPEQLETTSADQLLTRIQRYLQSPDGRRFAPDTARYQLERIHGWHRALQASRSRWRIGNGYSRRLRRQSWPSGVEAEAGGDEADEAGFSGPSLTGYLEHERTLEHPATTRHFDRHPEAIRPEDFDFDLESDAERQESRQAIREALHGAASVPPTPIRRPNITTAAQSSASEQTATKVTGSRFHLNLDDAVEAAPSIGPRTAERFTAIGVESIRDFLRQTAESMAEKINFKRISADVIRQWQQQTRLVCSIPNLRGHDAQLLVAVGVTEAEQLAGLAPKKLWSLIGPYCETKEGLKIIRAGKKPDLQEVTEWIQWAQQNRSLQAA
jgi:hypothetical protein